ncbi:hypothetical protein LTR56_005242 [Elasticomyces elasticus]|nr:hypothetical protein LTR56_005242 [Elasticomyces elasticus]KAK4923618.1 hypothetical protein LTR49_009173 [Elasticomyces elasticus]
MRSSKGSSGLTMSRRLISKACVVAHLAITKTDQGSFINRCLSSLKREFTNAKNKKLFLFRTFRGVFHLDMLKHHSTASPGIHEMVSHPLMHPASSIPKWPPTAIWNLAAADQISPLCCTAWSAPTWLKHV